MDFLLYQGIRRDNCPRVTLIFSVLLHFDYMCGWHEQNHLQNHSTFIRASCWKYQRSGLILRAEKRRKSRWSKQHKTPRASVFCWQKRKRVTVTVLAPGTWREAWALSLPRDLIHPYSHFHVFSIYPISHFNSFIHTSIHTLLDKHFLVVFHPACIFLCMTNIAVTKSLCII